MMTSQIDQTTIYVPTNQAVVSRVGAETVLLHLENGTYYGLDPVGTRVWELLQGSSTLGAICDVLHEEYGVSKQVLMDDMRAFFLELAGQDLIHGQQNADG
jgi:hypothetical protein